MLLCCTEIALHFCRVPPFLPVYRRKKKSEKEKNLSQTAFLKLHQHGTDEARNTAVCLTFVFHFLFSHLLSLCWKYCWNSPDHAPGCHSNSRSLKGDQKPGACTNNYLYTVYVSIFLVPRGGTEAEMGMCCWMNGVKTRKKLLFDLVELMC